MSLLNPTTNGYLRPHQVSRRATILGYQEPCGFPHQVENVRVPLQSKKSCSGKIMVSSQACRSLFVDLTEFKDPRQGTKSSGDHANSMQYDWMRGLISDGMLDFEDHSVVDQEISHLSRAISKNAVNENLSVLANEVAPSQAVVASTAMTKPTHKPKTPNADLTHTVGTGRLATSRVRKALPRKKRRQELAVTQNSGQCFKCKFVGNSVRASN